MIQKSLLFFNLFGTKDINPTRLYSFGTVVLGALQAANDKKQFDAIIAQLSAALEALYKELSAIDQGMSKQKIDTRTVDQLIVDFYTCMSNNEGVIAMALGGKTSEGFLTFYPNMQTEYSKATKKRMPFLTGRVAAAAQEYAGQLDARLVEELTSYKALFVDKYGKQQSKIIEVGKDRKERGNAFAEAQHVLTAAVYTVGAAYPNNPEKCHSFFPFKMLYPSGHRKRYMLKATLKENEGKEILNHVLNKTAEIICANKSVNARFAFWLAASPTEPMPADAYIVNAGEAPLKLKADKLGDLQQKPFVMVKNLSHVNACACEISFVGLKNAIAGAEVSVEEESPEIMLAL